MLEISTDSDPRVTVVKNAAGMTIEVVGRGVTYRKERPPIRGMDSEKLDQWRIRTAMQEWQVMVEAVYDVHGAENG